MKTKIVKSTYFWHICSFSPPQKKSIHFVNTQIKFLLHFKTVKCRSHQKIVQLHEPSGRIWKKKQHSFIEIRQWCHCICTHTRTHNSKCTCIAEVIYGIVILYKPYNILTEHMCAYQRISRRKYIDTGAPIHTYTDMHIRQWQWMVATFW